MAPATATAPVRDGLVLGLDLGTSAVKLVAIDDVGSVLASASAGFATSSAIANQAEQDCGDWIAATAQTFTALGESLALSHGAGWRGQVKAIGLTGQLPTLVCVGVHGPVGPAITWKDGRADEWAEKVLDRRERRRIYERTGMPIDGRYLGPMWRYHYAAADTDPAWLLSAKDYLGYALTGQAGTDPSTAAGYGAFELDPGEFNAELAARWDIPMHALPPVRAPGDVLAPLSLDGAAVTGLPPGIPVMVGAADSVCSAYAMGGLTEGLVCVTMGSSAVIIDAVREARLDPSARYLLTPHVATGWYGREMDLLASGTGHEWLSRLLGWSPGGLDRAASESEPGARGLSFAPYLAGGEQGVLWNPALTGSLTGLSLRHTQADIARAFLEGVYFEIKRCVDVLAETSPVDALVVSGHFVEHPTSVQLLADILNRPVQPLRTPSPAALGAALVARHRGQVGPPDWRAAITAPAVSPGGDAARYPALYRHYLKQSSR